MTAVRWRVRTALVPPLLRPQSAPDRMHWSPRHHHHPNRPSTPPPLRPSQENLVVVDGDLSHYPPEHDVDVPAPPGARVVTAEGFSQDQMQLLLLRAKVGGEVAVCVGGKESERDFTCVCACVRVCVCACVCVCVRVCVCA